jgi:hypothetical protein
VAAGIFITAVVDSRAPSEQSSPTRERGGFAADGPLYESFDQLVSQSNLIVTGTVQETVVGKVFGDDPTGKYPTRHLHTVIGVEEVLKGSDVREVTVITDELAFTGTNTEEWRTQGSGALLFLTPSSENKGLHLLANINYIQTVYTLHGDDVRKTMGGDLYGLNDRIAEMSLPDIRETIRGREASSEADEVFFPTWTSKSRPQSIVTGVLAEHDRCLFLDRSDPERPKEVLPLWEKGYSYSDGELLDSSGEAVVSVGEELHGGGGYFSDWKYAEQLAKRTIPTRCRPDGDEPFAVIYDVQPGPSD